MIRKAVCIALLLFLSPSAVFAWGGWKTLKTDRFVVFYKEGQEGRALEALEALEANRPLAEFISGHKGGRIPVVLEDGGDLSNGWANGLLNQLNLFASPPRSGTLGYTPDWWGLLGVHETIHSLQISNATLIPGFLTAVFGNALQPNIFIPSFLLEGMAVYGESRISPFAGRLNDGFFHAYMAACLAEGKTPGFVETVAEPPEFPLERAYLFGALFADYLASTRGEDRFGRFADVNGSSPLSYLSPLLPFAGVDRSANIAFGKSLPGLWREWLDHEKDSFKGFKIDGNQLTDRGWYVEAVATTGGRVYTQRFHAEKIAAGRLKGISRIVETDPITGDERVITEVNSAFGGPLRAGNGKLVYAVQETFFGWPNVTYLGFGLGSNIYVRDIATGVETLRLRGNIRAFELLPDGRIVFSKDRRDRFGSVILEQDGPGGTARPIFETDLLVDQLSSDGKSIVAVARPDGANFGIYEVSLRTATLTPLVQTPFAETNACVAGNRVYFRANYGRVYRIYAFDINTRKAFRATRGDFADMPAVDTFNRMLYFAGLHSRGLDVWQTFLALEPFELPKVEEVPSPRLKSKLKPEDVTEGGYLDNLATLWPRIVRTPTMDYSPDRGADIGLLLLGTDALGHFNYTVETGYNTMTRRGRISIDLDSYFFQPAFVGARVRNERVGLEFGVPFVRRLDPGMDVRITAQWYGFDDFSRNEFSPRFYAYLAGARFSALLDLQAPMESTDAGSSLNRTAFYGRLRLENHHFGELLLEGRYIYDPDNPRADVFPAIRGYAEALPGPCGGIVTAQFSLPLLKLRGGLWNPSIWFEDIVATVFADAAFQGRDRADWQASAGLEFRLETKILNSPAILFLPGIRGYVNLDGNIGIEPILEIALGF